jgi:hypothetical protein
MWTNKGGYWHFDTRPSETPEGKPIVEDVFKKPNAKRKPRARKVTLQASASASIVLQADLSTVAETPQTPQ